MTTNNDLSDTHTHIHVYAYVHYSFQYIIYICDGIYSHFARPKCTATVFIGDRVMSVDSSQINALTHIKTNSNEYIYTKVLYTIHTLSVCVFFLLLMLLLFLLLQKFVFFSSILYVTIVLLLIVAVV